MIEFKADCGHTVRAKDNDAGSNVRCSYCGKPATVPDARNDDLDFLFDDVEQQEASLSPRSRRKRERAARASRRGPAAPMYNPFPIVLRMGYAAVLICIVFFVGKKYVLPLLAEGGVSERSEQQTQRRPRRPRQGGPPSASTSQYGLINNRGPFGLYIGSTPPGAMVYYIEESAAPRRGRIQEGPGCTPTRANGDRLNLSDGKYVVDVVLASSDPLLNDRNRPDFETFRRFRRAIEDASDDDRARLLDEYFLPDEASEVFIDESDEQVFIVRRYSQVLVRNKRSRGVRALFLPRIGATDEGGFSLAQLVEHYIPKTNTYAIDEAAVRNELDFRGVPEKDRLFIVKALSRIGTIPYFLPDKKTRLFKIGIDDGNLTAPTLRVAGR